MTLENLKVQEYTTDDIYRLAQNQTFPVIKEYKASNFAGILSTIAKQTVDAELKHIDSFKFGYTDSYDYDTTKRVLTKVDENLREYFED